MAFVIRKFDHKLKLGDKLKALRKAANITLSEMVQKTKIQKKYIKAFENGQYHNLPDPIYARNFLRIYVNTLRTDPKYYLDLFEQERGTCDFVKKAIMPRQRTKGIKFLVASKFIKIGLILLTAFSVVTYMGIQVHSIVTAPELVIESPYDGITTKEASVLVAGQTEEGAQVSVNGTPVLLLSDGSFEEEIALERGLNIIKIEGAKRYSKKAIEYRRVVLKQNKLMTFAN